MSFFAVAVAADAVAVPCYTNCIIRVLQLFLNNCKIAHIQAVKKVILCAFCHLKCGKQSAIIIDVERQKAHRKRRRKKGRKKMNDCCVSVDGANYRRISKAAARKVYAAGLHLMLCPVGMRPGGPWCIGALVEHHDESFDSIINAFEHYNCSAKAGYYTAYYISE